MLVIAYFAIDGVPQTGLSPVCAIHNAATGASVVGGAGMAWVAAGFYRYDFFTHNNAVEYVVTCDGGVVLPAEQRYAVAVIEARSVETKVDGIKAKTDGLPASTDARIGAIDAVIAGIPTEAEVLSMLGATEQNIRGGSATVSSVSSLVATGNADRGRAPHHKKGR